MTFCYNGEEVVLFQSKCPVDGCNNNEDITWHHVGCKNGYKEYINSNGEIICTDCKKNLDSMKLCLIVVAMVIINLLQEILKD